MFFYVTFNLILNLRITNRISRKAANRTKTQTTKKNRLPPPELRTKTDQETEKKMDSGIYDMKVSLHKKEIEEIKMALKKENYELEERR